MSTFSIGQMNQLADKLQAAGFGPADVTKLGQYDDLAAFKDVLYGMSEIVKVKHVIDLDTEPHIPDGWKKEEHVPGGQFEWDPEKVRLHLDPGQLDGEWVEGNELRKKLSRLSVLNANLLDYLLAHQELIPESWKGKAVFFWGTIYRHPHGRLMVRCLGWGGGQWYWGYDWLDGGFGGDDPAAVRAS
jgi:hypothetical protein